HKGLRGHSEAPGLAPPGPPGRLVELSHPITAGRTTYPGLPGPEITPSLTREASRDRYAPGTEFAIDRITMLGNTGTYLDSPYHRYADGADLADLPLAALADLPAVVVRLADSAPPTIDVSARAPPGRPAPPHHRRRRAGRAGRGGPCGPAAHRLGPALGHRPLRPGRALPHRCGGAVARRPRRPAGRHRLGQHRRRGRRRTAGALAAAGRRDPGRGAPHRPGPGGRPRRPLP